MVQFGITPRFIFNSYSFSSHHGSYKCILRVPNFPYGQNPGNGPETLHQSKCIISSTDGIATFTKKTVTRSEPDAVMQLWKECQTVPTTTRQEPHHPAEAHSPSELVGHHAGEHSAQHAADAEDGHGDGPDAGEALRRDELAVPVVVRAVHPLFNDLPAREEDGAGQS